jgi:hypothetical protein
MESAWDRPDSKKAWNSKRRFYPSACVVTSDYLGVPCLLSVCRQSRTGECYARVRGYNNINCCMSSRPFR